ncbi:MAG: formyltetrahydrofolate deformylase [Candidatus Omnitrophica bacterium]|nr:formyltetrahydrofolate deformylase [Candidatus Omnitrophota bacterium]
MNAILLISCPDRKGIVYTVTDFIFKNNGNILDADQHIDDQSNIFFMRLEWSLVDFGLGKDDIIPAFSAIAERFCMQWSIVFSDQTPNLAIYVSRHLHCLQDLLARYQSGQLRCHIPLIISNHKEAERIARLSDMDYFYVPITPDNKIEQEQRQTDILAKYRIDVIVLARYHQIFTGEFVARHENKMINIHHSFLPAFVGKKPYNQAYEKGVKLIGATSHYVTGQLDQGPIIEQDTVRISHRDALTDLVRKGEDLEKVVLGRAVRFHLERKVLVYNNKTVVFD